MNDSKKIKVVIAGLGNCSKSLIEGISYYTKRPDETVEGVMSQDIMGYKISDIEVVGAIDVDSRKIGHPVSQAIYRGPNNAMPIIDNGWLGITCAYDAIVVKGPVLDGVAKHMTDEDNYVFFRVDAEQEPVNVAAYLKDMKENRGAEMLVNYLPVGSEKAVQNLATSCLSAGIGFVNMMPVFIASNPEWSNKFKAAGLPCIGDDIKAQAGATILHRALVQTLEDRGVRVLRTSQHNYGGNTDFMNMIDLHRLKSKKVSKTNAVTSCVKDLDALDQNYNVVIGPAGFVPYQGDNKTADIKIEATGWCGAPVSIAMQLSVEDSPNSAGIGVDAIRLLRVALDQGFAGAVETASAYLMKTPPMQMNDMASREACVAIANGSEKIS